MQASLWLATVMLVGWGGLISTSHIGWTNTLKRQGTKHRQEHRLKVITEIHAIINTSRETRVHSKMEHLT